MSKKSIDSAPIPFLTEVNEFNTEKKDLENIAVLSDSDSSEQNIVYKHEANLVRGLNQRCLSMITVTGIFGTGLFLLSGGSLATAGNASIFICYIVVGLVVAANQVANIEILTFMAVTHGPVRHAEFFVDKAASFALGWIGIYSAIMPGELAATALIMNYWTDINLALWISIFGVVIVATNLISIKFFGRFEYVAGALKLLLVVMLIIVGLVIDLGGAPGQERLGFRYWKESPFQEFHLSGDLGKFLAWYKALSGVVYSFGGVQLFNFFSGETQNPRKSLFKAARRVLIRTFTLYVLAILILSLIVSSNDESIASSTGTAEGSPWVIAIKRAGINVLPHVINAIVLTSAFSAANLGLVHCLRGLFALASVGNAPKIFLKTNSRGIPMYGIAFGALFLPLCYMSVSETSANVFNWFQNITSGYLLLGWVFIAVNHLSMVRALHAQGYTRDVLPYKIKGGVYFSVFSLVMSTVFLLTQGFSVFLEGQWSTSKFITTYLVLPVFFSLALFWKIYKKTKFVNPAEVDLQALFDDIENHPEPPLKKLRWWQYVTVFWI